VVSPAGFGRDEPWVIVPEIVQIATAHHRHVQWLQTGGAIYSASGDQAGVFIRPHLRSYFGIAPDLQSTKPMSSYLESVGVDKSGASSTMSPTVVGRNFPRLLRIQAFVQCGRRVLRRRDLHIVDRHSVGVLPGAGRWCGWTDSSPAESGRPPLLHSGGLFHSASLFFIAAPRLRARLIWLWASVSGVLPIGT